MNNSKSHCKQEADAARLRIFHVCCSENFVIDISASTGKNDFVFDIWLLHGDLYVSALSRFTTHLLSVTIVSITANMNNSKSHGKQEIDVR
jgi:hypothetical protein